METLKVDPSLLAIITAGSIAQGSAKESSDIDVYLLVTDESYAKRKKDNLLSYINHDVCEYEGGYIDGKIVNRRFLELAAEQGSEPTRASFIGSKVFYSRVLNLDSILSRIPVYPEANRTRI